MEHEKQGESPDGTKNAEPFEEPELTYLTPELREIGKVQELTQQFIGAFSP